MAPTLTPEAWAHIRYDYEHTERPIEDICAEHGTSSGTLRDRMRRWGWTRRRPPIPREGPPPLPAPRAEIAPLAAARAFDAVVPSTPHNDSPRPAASHSLGGDPPPPGEGKSADPGATCATPSPHIAAGESADPPSENDDSSIVPRLQSAVARVLPAIETIVAKLGTGATHPREMEQAGRALGALTRALRELNGLLSERRPPDAGDSTADTPAGKADDDDKSSPQDLDAFRLELMRRMNAVIAARTDNTDGEALPSPHDAESGSEPLSRPQVRSV